MKPHDWKLLATLVAIGVLIYVGRNGIHPRQFSMEWNEEVKLHDGRMIIVRVKRSFERYERFDRWAARSLDTEIEFDHGPPWGRVTRNFQRFDVEMIETRSGNWYFSLSPTTGIPPKKLVTQRFPVLILPRDGEAYAARSWDDVPDFPRHNLMPVTPSPQGISKFEGTLLTWDVKMAHWRSHPRAAGDDGIIIHRHTTTEKR